MARLKGTLNFTGSIGNLSAYNNRTVDDILVRTKGGPTKQQIEKSPRFKNTRRNNAEFSGASTTAAAVKDAIGYLEYLDHTSFQSRLVSICCDIKKLDTENDWGQRSYYVSRCRYWLEGFQLEMGTQFDSIIKHPLQCSINRNELSASIFVPALFPKIGLYVPGKFSFYRITAVLGIVPDMKYSGWRYDYVPINSNIQLWRADLSTAWFSTVDITEEQNLLLQIQRETNMSDNDSLVLTVGVEFGTAASANLIRPVTNAGAAKIMAVA